MDTVFDVIQTPGGGQGQLGIAFAMALMGAFVNFITEFSLDDQRKDRLKAGSETKEHFEFIVVGAGSAGGVIASRLSENFKVLLLEAGGETNPMHSIPMFAVPLAVMPYVDWGYQTVPQNNSCLASHGQKIKWPRGKALGGTSNLNFMIYSRGHPDDYNNWAKITGDSRWAYENVLKYFKKSEDFQSGDPKFENSRYHSKGGPLKVMESPVKGVIQNIVEGAEEFGIPYTDLNAEYVEGIMPLYVTEDKGRRCGVGKAFVEPARKRKTLTVYKYAHVTKVLLDEATNRAIGVEYTRHGVTRKAFSSKEVIISAGALNSPQILMLSGLGPRDQLQKFNIPVIQHLPGVGKNLQDHYGSFLTPFLAEAPEEIKQRTPWRDWIEYWANSSGPMSSSGFEGNMLVVSNHTRTERGEPNWPDLQIFFSGAQNTFIKTGLAQLFNMKEDALMSYFGQYEGQYRLSVVNMVVRPYSRGTVTLQSADPLTPMLFDPKYFSDERDMEILVDGAKRAVQILERSHSMQALGTRFVHTAFPGCEQVPFKSDAYWDCFHRQLTVTVWHPTSTCAMGKRTDPDAVVDSRLRVHGVRNLRVADASVMPVIPAGNTNAPSIMVGEMAADIIKDAWKDPGRVHTTSSSSCSPSCEQESFTFSKVSDNNQQEWDLEMIADRGDCADLQEHENLNEY